MKTMQTIFCYMTFKFFASLSTALSRTAHSFRDGCLVGNTLATCLQRPGGLAQRRLLLTFMRATNVQFRTAFSTGILPPLRQTASCRQCIFPSCHCIFCFNRAKLGSTTVISLKNVKSFILFVKIALHFIF